MAIATSLELVPSSSNYNNNTRTYNSSPCTSTSTYDVFLSFRGEDTRLSFTDHLYTALVDAGFRTFRDDDELERGENIKPELQKAIQHSKCSVIVFSKDYASSGWCLDELVAILERKKNISSTSSSDRHHVVLPVFYNVDPSDVRKQTGNFAKAFARHEERFKEEISKVNRWRAALGEAADLAGMNLQNQADRHEAKFIKKIVIVVEDKLRRTPLSVTPYLIGIDSQAKTINLWLEDGSSDVGILLICGIPGIGKTTIAKSVFNSNFNRFEGSAFLENISSEISGQSNGLVHLQRKLLSILTSRDVIIHNVSEGTNKIRDVVGSKRVILVLDDVDHVDTLDAILGMRDWFYPGSKIIVTTRQHAQSFIKAREVCKVHVVQQLDNEGSLKLFCWHAFGQDHPINEHYKQLSKRVAGHCGGLPLALKTLGSSLSGRSIDYWEDAMKKLKDIPDSKILRTLRLGCYDTLQDDHDQNLFLDIACFFIGKHKDFIVTILDECDFHTKIGIQNLIDRYLITIDVNNRVWMHNLLRDMGREIIRQESPKEPGKRSRLWKDKDSYNVLLENTGENTIEGIVLHGRNIPPINSNEVVLETNAFAKMGKLRLLILSDVQLSRSYESFPKRLRSWLSSRSGYESFPKGLRWLNWRGFPLDSIPSDFLLESLVVLDMRYSNLRQVWKVSKCLPQLKILNLSQSHYLTKTPDFSLLPKLERLFLKDCASLATVHESICMLKLLEILDISGCSNLTKFPLLEFRKMESIKVFHANGTPMNRWLNTVGGVKSLANPLPRFLVVVSLVNCNLSDDDFPLDFSNLLSLQILNLSENQISRLPDCIRSLHGLDILSFMNCEKLQSVVGLPRIKELNLSYCHSLEKITFQSSSDRPYFMGYTYYKNLVEFENWFKLEAIESIDVEMINILGLCNLESLQDISINIASKIWGQTKRLPIKGIHEQGIFNIFLPGNEIPGRFSKYHKSRDSSISFILPILPIKIQGLNVSIIYAIDKKPHDFPLRPPVTTQVNNKSKGLKWIYSPTFFGYPDEGKDMIWLSHWKLGNQQLEGGDEVIVSIYLDRSKANLIKLKEWGIQVVYEQEQKMCTQENTTDNPSDHVGGICDYWEVYREEMAGTYFLKGGPGNLLIRDVMCRWYNDFHEKAAIKNRKRWVPLKYGRHYLYKEVDETMYEYYDDEEEEEEEAEEEGYIDEEGEDETTSSQITPPAGPPAAPPPPVPQNSPRVPSPPEEYLPAADDDHQTSPCSSSFIKRRRMC